MATTMTPPSAGADAGLSAGGGDLDLGSVLGEGFDAAMESAEEEGTPAGEEGSDPTQPGSGEEDTPAGEAPQGSQPQPQEQGQPQPSPSDPYPLSPDGKSYLVPKGDLASIQAARSFQTEVGKFFQNAQEAQTSYLQASDLRAMGNDWINGSDAAIKGVMQHWAGMNHSQNPQIQARYQQSFVKMAQQMPGMLQQLNPQAYSTMVEGMVGKAIENAYAKAAQTGNPDDLLKAQQLDWGVTGQYKTEIPKSDPQSQQMADFQRREQEFNQRQEAALRRDSQLFNSQNVEGAKYGQLDRMIDQVLAPVKDRFSEVAFQDMRTGIRNDVLNSLKNQPEWYLEHQQHFDQIMGDFGHLWRNGQNLSALQPRVNAYVQDFLSRAKRALPEIAQKRIGQTTRSPKPTGQKGQPPSPRQRPQAPAQPDPQKRLTSQEWDKELAEAFRVR